MKPLLALFIGLFILSSLAAASFSIDPHDLTVSATNMQTDLHKAEDSIRTLNRELGYMQQYKEWHDKTVTKIAEIKSEGYKPDQLLIALIYRRAEKWKCVNVDSLFHISKRETSYGSNNVKGELGEEGWAQFTEETLRFQILFFEGDTVGFDPADYADNVTTTDWVFTTYIFAKMHKSKNANPDWVNDWNSGAYMKPKERGGR